MCTEFLKFYLLKFFIFHSFEYPFPVFVMSACHFIIISNLKLTYFVSYRSCFFFFFLIVHFLLFLYFFIFLATQCSMWDLSSLTKGCSMWDLMHPLHWNLRVLTTRPLGKSLKYLILKKIIFYQK